MIKTITPIQIQMSDESSVLSALIGVEPTGVVSVGSVGVSAGGVSEGKTGPESLDGGSTGLFVTGGVGLLVGGGVGLLVTGGVGLLVGGGGGGALRASMISGTNWVVIQVNGRWRIEHVIGGIELIIIGWLIIIRVDDVGRAGHISLRI